MTQLVAVYLPGTIALLCLGYAQKPIRESTSLLLIAAVASTAMALPPIQDIFHFGSRPATNTYLLPVFPVLYILFGRFKTPSVALTFCGTFFTLLLGDLVAASKFSFVDGFGIDAYGWIGGAGVMDGLLILPLSATAMTWFVRFCLNRGMELPILVGRTAHMRMLSQTP